MGIQNGFWQQLCAQDIVVLHVLVVVLLPTNCTTTVFLNLFTFNPTPPPHFSTRFHGTPPPPQAMAWATAPSPRRPTPGVVKQDKSSRGSVGTTKTHPTEGQNEQW